MRDDDKTVEIELPGYLRSSAPAVAVAAAAPRPSAPTEKAAHLWLLKVLAVAAILLLSLLVI